MCIRDSLKEKNIQNPKDMVKFTPDKTLEAIFEAKTNEECSMMWGHFVETFKLLMPVERFWEPGKLIAGTLGAQGKSEPTLTAAMILKPTSVACERFIYLLDELVALMCCYMDSYSRQHVQGNTLQSRQF